MHKINYKIAIALVFLAFPAMATELEPLNMSGKYSLTFSGLPMGQCNITAQESGNHYSMTSTVKLSGLIRLFASHSSQTTVSGSSVDFTQGPRVYESNYKTKNKPRHIRLTYDAHGALSEQIVEPPDDPANRPPPTQSQKNNSLDLLSMVPQLRRLVADAPDVKGAPLVIPIYDGKRLMNAEFSVMGNSRIIVNNREMYVIKVIARRKPIAGYTAKELKDIQKSNPDVEIYFTPAPALIPVKLRAAVTLGTLEATLIQ